MTEEIEPVDWDLSDSSWSERVALVHQIVLRTAETTVDTLVQESGLKLKKPMGFIRQNKLTPEGEWVFAEVIIVVHHIIDRICHEQSTESEISRFFDSWDELLKELPFGVRSHFRRQPSRARKYAKYEVISKDAHKSVAWKFGEIIAQGDDIAIIMPAYFSILSTITAFNLPQLMMQVLK